MGRSPRDQRFARRRGSAVLLLVALAWIVLMQAPGSNQNAHLALVKSLARGTPSVDAYHRETPDVSYIDGRYYTAKAPGLALATTPYYLALRAAHLDVADHVSQVPYPEAMYRLPRSALWEVGIVGAALPAFVLLLLVRRVGDELAPGHGTLAAVLLGCGSLVATFATLFFAHALSATLGFAAFAVLVRERRRPAFAVLALAGVLAGFAVVVEFPLAIVALALAGFVLAGRDRARRLAAYASGVAVGLVPLGAFNWWAFGSPLTLSYTNAVVVPGRSGHDVIGANARGFFGVDVPSLRAGVELLASSKGLVVLTPVWALGTVGVVLLWRRGERAVAALIAAVTCAFLVYDAAYYLPFGGFPGGPRFLVPILPFLAVGVAAAARSFPLTTLCLGLASVAVSTAALVVDPGSRSEDAGSWFHALERGHVTRTVVGWLGGANGAGVAISIACVAVATVVAVATARPAVVARRELGAALAALCLWRAFYVGAPILLEDGTPGWLALVTVLLLLVSAAACVVLGYRSGPVGFAPGLALVLLAWPAFAAHTALAAAATAAAAVACVAVALRRRWLGGATGRPQALV